MIVHMVSFWYSPQLDTLTVNILQSQINQEPFGARKVNRQKSAKCCK
jgi:hypothetical protein